MKNTKTMLMATVMMFGLAATVMAQPQERGKKGGQRGGDQGQDRMMRFIQAFPVMAALDADKNGTISAQEIAGASAALGKLDADGDGALSMEELRPRRPQGGPGKGGAGKGQGGPGKGGPGKGGAGKGKGGAGKGGGGKGKRGAGAGGGKGGSGGGQRPQRPAADE